MLNVAANDVPPEEMEDYLCDRKDENNNDDETDESEDEFKVC